MNPELYRLHRVLFALSVFGTFMILFFDLQLASTLRATIYGGALVALSVPMAVLHFFAAKGAREGRRYGIVLSRIVGALWLVEFPVGTLIGAYVLWKGRNWRTAASEQDLSLSFGAT